jgi:hypothetical protein
MALLGPGVDEFGLSYCSAPEFLDLIGCPPSRGSGELGRVVKSSSCRFSRKSLKEKLK